MYSDGCVLPQYDKSRRGALSAEEFRLVVADLGVLVRSFLL